jgi:hypothetical protein
MRLYSRLVSLLALCGLLAPLALAQATPASLSACQAITTSGSYKVRQNIDATGDCFVIQADYVTINLAGYVISGDGTGSGITDEGNARSGITVRGGVLANFDTGVDLAASTGSMLQNLRVLDNVSNGLLAGGSSMVSNCLVAGHSTTGIAVGAGSLVAGNTVNGGNTGIDITCATLLKGHHLTESTDALVTTGSDCQDIDGVEVDG